MNKGRRMLVLGATVTPLLGAGLTGAARDSGNRTTELYIRSDGEEMAFLPVRLRCRSGKRVRVHFRHCGTLSNDPHDWVLLKPGMLGVFVAAADKQKDERQVIPPGLQTMVLASTPLCSKGRTVSVEFVAPAPGDYPYVCSVPGHGESMNGILQVTT